MQNGLLESLSKYHPRKNITPLENFITEAFAWILNNNKEFGSHLLKIVTANLPLSETDFDEPEWKTQFFLKGVYPDMVCITENYAFIFEHKTYSNLHDDQLSNYRTYSGDVFPAKSVYIVMITAESHQHSDEADIKLCWRDIYKIIDDWIQSGHDEQWVLSDFNKLIVSEGMGPPAPISHVGLLHFNEAIRVKKETIDLVNRIFSRFTDKFEGILSSDYKPVINKQWGRVGFHVLEHWNPGFFIGFLLDGTDHCTPPLSEDKGPDFCLIIDIAKDKYPDYEQLPEYNALVAELSTLVEKDNYEWSFYNHLDERSPNRWHPIHIRKPALDILASSISAQEQEEAILEASRQLINFIKEREEGENSFWNMKRALEETAIDQSD